MTDRLLVMSAKELDRFQVVQRFIHKEITRAHAAALLGLSEGHISRLKDGVVDQGAAALIHGNRGKPANNRVPRDEREEVIRLLHAHYHDFRPTHASEKLAELHQIDRDPKTIRQIMIDEDLWRPKKRQDASTHRAWRPRKEAYGQMIQFDGSYHDWFEGREGHMEICLLAAIDDATGRVVLARFMPHEGVFPVFSFWHDYCLEHGKPRMIYLDKFSTYKMNPALLRENHELKTQFERACQDLAIVPIHANSPQAKGRVERLFETFQDRLIKEMRLAGINTPEEGDRFLAEVFLPWFNRRFGVAPASDADLHRQLTDMEHAQLNSIFSRQTPRTIQSDFTLSFENTWYQLVKDQPVTVRPKERVVVEEHLNGLVQIRLRGKHLNYKILPSRPKRSGQIPWVLVKTAAGAKLQGLQVPAKL